MRMTIVFAMKKDLAMLKNLIEVEHMTTVK